MRSKSMGQKHKKKQNKKNEKINIYNYQIGTTKK